MSKQYYLSLLIPNKTSFIIVLFIYLFFFSFCIKYQFIIVFCGEKKNCHKKIFDIKIFGSYFSLQPVKCCKIVQYLTYLQNGYRINNFSPGLVFSLNMCKKFFLNQIKKKKNSCITGKTAHWSKFTIPNKEPHRKFPRN